MRRFERAFGLVLGIVRLVLAPEGGHIQRLDGMRVGVKYKSDASQTIRAVSNRTGHRETRVWQFLENTSKNIAFAGPQDWKLLSAN